MRKPSAEAFFWGGTVGNGGNATSTATANASGGNSATALSNATGRAGGSGPNNSTAGTANATSSATAAGSGQASAQAVVSGASAGAATATSTSNSGAGPSVSASASAPVGGNATAKTLSYFGGFGLPGITAGTSISDVTGQPRHFSLTPNVLAAFGHGTVDALGAMSIGYGGNGQSLTYQTTASFQFAHPANSDFLLGLMSQGSLGTGFDSATLEVFVNSMLAYEQSSWSL